ncbi:hypothetical protein Bbelb_098090 [Branchiostoma belcheri]|nr:hypothetical protein Bbelb_098090 [Branchiostoma belcheri]
MAKPLQQWTNQALFATLRCATATQSSALRGTTATRRLRAALQAVLVQKVSTEDILTSLEANFKQQLQTINTALVNTCQAFANAGLHTELGCERHNCNKTTEDRSSGFLSPERECVSTEDILTSLEANFKRQLQTIYTAPVNNSHAFANTDPGL